MELIIPVIENDPSDFELIKAELTSEHLWLEATGPLEWLRRYRITPRMMQDNDANKHNKVTPKLALIEALSTGASVLVLDVGLSGDEEKVVREIGDTLKDETDMDRFWNSNKIESVGGFWILREIQKLREKGFAVPAVAIGTNFGRFTGSTMPWPHFLLKRGATWVFPKPFSEIAAKKLLDSLVVIMAGGMQSNLSIKLAGHYFQSSGKEEGKLWEDGQQELFDLLDRALIKDEITNQRDRAQALGIAYNTYRSWVQKLEDKKL